MVKSILPCRMRFRRNAITHAAGVIALACLVGGCGKGPVYEPDAPLHDRPELLATTDVSYAKPSDALLADLSYYSCDNCHAIDHHRLGPALAEVGAVYAEADEQEVEQLAGHITDGVEGRWGSVPMPAQPAVSHAKAEVLAAEIIALGR